MSKVKILFVAADPLSIDGHERRLLLDVEARKIEQEVNAALHRDDVEIKTCWATRIEDLRRELNRERPHIVHFSGHGGGEGLVLMAEDGTGPRRVDAEALREFFRAFRDRIRLVVLNACESHPQAQAIAEVIECAIGTHGAILDDAAIAFSTAFYSPIVFGKSVQTAFDQAKATLRMEGFPKQELPELIHRPDVDPAQLVLISADQPAARPSRRPRAVAAALAAVALSCGAVYAARFGNQSATTAIACARARDVLSAALASGTTAPPSVKGLLNTGAASATAAGPSADPMAAAKDLHAAGNHAAAFPLFKAAAKAGNREAMGFVGVAYLRGEGTPPNPDSAFVWLDRARDAKDARGMNGMGEAFQRGFGVNRSDRWAAHWFRASAEKHFPEAMRNLGSMYRDGLHVTASGERALELYEGAARAGFADAMVDAGVMYEKGLAVPADPEAARCWYDAGARAGSARGMVALGQVYESRQNYGEAKEWYLKALDAGSADAMNNLAVLYQNGWGVQRDSAEARRLFQRAADAGSTVARSNLAALGTD